ncbi:SLC13 family permease [candidate division KSB1 bacterium]
MMNASQATHPQGTVKSKPGKKIDMKRVFFILLGLSLFFIVYFLPPLPAASDPAGKLIPLSHEGKAAVGLFLLAAIWWVFEVIPIGVTSITIAVVQALFLIRSADVAFMDFMQPSVWFIFGSIIYGIVFTKTGIAKRMAYKMLSLVGERTSMIYLGCFVMTSAMTLIMAHTAVAATVYPLFMAIYALYGAGDEPTKFGKGLFLGMAFTAGAGSIITLLGAARGAVAIDLYKQFVGTQITFFELTYYMIPVGVIMTLLLWIFFMVMFKPEKKTIPGLRERAQILYERLGPMSIQEKGTIAVVGMTIAMLSLRSFIGPLAGIDKSAIILVSIILFYLFEILSLKELEEIPWNIILLFGGAMSIGFCLKDTGAAEWIAGQWLVLFQDANWFIFIGAITFLMLILTNLIMNVAAISILLPVGLILAEYMNIAPEVILFACLAAAGMPFLFLVGAAPNAIAYNSKQFTTGEFFIAGIPASIMLMLVLAAFVYFIWPMMGMPIRIL